MLLFKLLLFIFANLFCSALAQDVVGSRCIRHYDNKYGFCRRISSCPSAQVIQQRLGIRPEICGRANDGEFVVCCVEFAEPVTGVVQDNRNNAVRPTIRTTTQTPSGFNRLGSNKRINELKCEKYSAQVQTVHTFVSLSANIQEGNHVVPKCNFKASPLIVGGEDARQGEFPHMALIGWTLPNGRVKWSCGGTLISERFVLTAAHCQGTLKEEGKINPDVVRLGEHNVASNNDGANPIDVRIKQVIWHPDYRSRKYDDLSLLELQDTVVFNNFIRPACLWNADSFDGDNAIATGWGVTEFGGPKSDILQKVELQIYPRNQCVESYRSLINRKFRNGIIDTQFCAGHPDGDKDACQGDSGGPLQIQNQKNPCIYYIIGITSFGKGCGAADSPGVYTRVSKYIDWIERVVWANE